ncbi:alpha/beta fold hydrolase [Escherichia coli]|uniref:alpha/beta fold hydrolase n=1 Tax=Escherichia coli TaxID=562 RepID=UPI000AFF9DDC|nr:alpha/beta hydrolase [Escherichia coli]
MSYQPQTEAATSRFLNVEEAGKTLRIHFNDCGQGDETVVLLHGSGPGATGWANFSRNIDPLVEAGYRVILLDCPGWGKSDSIVNSGSRSDLNARILKSVVDQLDIAKIHLLGNSMGGHSSVAFTLNWPERVGKLVLMGGGTGGMSLFTPMPTEGIKRLNQLYRQPTIENLKLMMDIFVFDTSDLTYTAHLVWPNNMREGNESKLTLIGTSGNAPRSISFSGPWAQFRLFGAGQLTGVQDGNFTVRFSVDGGAMTYRVHTDTEDNPFSGGLFSQFGLSDTLY